MLTESAIYTFRKRTHILCLLFPFFGWPFDASDRSIFGAADFTVAFGDDVIVP